MADHSRLELWLDIHHLTIFDCLSDIKHGKRLSNAQIHRVVGQYTPRTNATPEPENNAVRICFRLPAVNAKEALRFEYRRVMIYLRIMGEGPKADVSAAAGAKRL